MANQVTVTAKTGIGQSVTAKVIPNVSSVIIDTAAQVLRVYTGGPQATGTLVQDFDISAITTLTCTVSGGTFAFTFS